MSPRMMLATILLLATSPALASDEQAVRDADARYWQTFNACDLPAMDALFTDDVEFYHDKTGLTTSKAAVIDSLRKGPCANPQMRLRREQVEGSLRFHPLAGGYALLSGMHRFYVREAGRLERLDGQAEFTNLWQSVGGHWRMRRVFSYAHGPVPYVPPITHLTLSDDALSAFAGRYRGEHVGDIIVVVDGDGLKLTAGDLVVSLRAESPSRFFALERDLRFKFVADADKQHVPALTIYENGAVAETAARAE
ncbi:MAG: nuclear transport factor 2 family protein [Pseudoxanthomonas sp.]